MPLSISKLASSLSLFMKRIPAQDIYSIHEWANAFTTPSIQNTMTTHDDDGDGDDDCVGHTFENLFYSEFKLLHFFIIEFRKGRQYSILWMERTNSAIEEAHNRLSCVRLRKCFQRFSAMDLETISIGTEEVIPRPFPANDRCFFYSIDCCLALIKFTPLIESICNWTSRRKTAKNT